MQVRSTASALRSGAIGRSCSNAAGPAGRIAESRVQHCSDRALPAFVGAALRHPRSISCPTRRPVFTRALAASLRPHCSPAWQLRQPACGRDAPYWCYWRPCCSQAPPPVPPPKVRRRCSATAPYQLLRRIWATLLPWPAHADAAGRVLQAAQQRAATLAARGDDTAPWCVPPCALHPRRCTDAATLALPFSPHNGIPCSATGAPATPPLMPPVSPRPLPARRVEPVSWRPRAFVFHNFLTAAEADHIVAQAKPFVSLPRPCPVCLPAAVAGAAPLCVPAFRCSVWLGVATRRAAAAALRPVPPLQPSETASCIFLPRDGSASDPLGKPTPPCPMLIGCCLAALLGRR